MIETKFNIIEGDMSELGIDVSKYSPISDEALSDLRYKHLMTKGLQ